MMPKARPGDGSDPAVSAHTPAAPTIAAVVLNYNYARYVADAITSVLQQSVAFDQVLVVDDGSTDNSLQVIHGFGDRVTVIEKPNGGTLSASLAALERCETDYIIFLDADDMLAPEACQAIRETFDRNPVKVQFQLASIDADGKALHSVFPAFPSGYNAAAMQRDNRDLGFYLSPPTSGNVYRCGFLRSLALTHLSPRAPIDGTPNMIAPYAGEIATIPRPLGNYRLHTASLSQWTVPSVARLQYEIERLSQRWDEARVLNSQLPPTAAVAETLFVAERRLMIAALDRDQTATHVNAYLRSLWRTRLPVTLKTGFTVWAVLFHIPLSGLRRRLVLARRSPGMRPAIVNRAIVGIKRLAGMTARRGHSPMART